MVQRPLLVGNVSQYVWRHIGHPKVTPTVNPAKYFFQQVIDPNNEHHCNVSVKEVAQLQWCNHPDSHHTQTHPFSPLLEVCEEVREHDVRVDPVRVEGDDVLRPRRHAEQHAGAGRQRAPQARHRHQVAPGVQAVAVPGRREREKEDLAFSASPGT